jgi:hypothetical protein
MIDNNFFILDISKAKYNGLSIYKKFYKLTFHNIINLPSAVKTAKSRSQLTFRQIAGIRESAFSISLLFTITDGEEIIRQGFARWPDIIQVDFIKGVMPVLCTF